MSGGRWSGGVSGLSEFGDNGYKVGIAPHSRKFVSFVVPFKGEVFQGGVKDF